MTTKDKIRNQSEVSQGRLFFPNDVVNGEHFIQFLPKKYEYIGTSKSGFVEKIDKSGSITLPLPKNLQDSYNAQWSNEPIGAIGDAVGRIINTGDFSKNDLSDIMSDFTIEAAKSQFLPIATAALAAGFGSGTIGAIGSALATVAGQGALTGAGVGFGLASNPFLATLFQGMNMRNHSFSFEMFAKSPDESRKIKRIIDRFRYNMLPDYFENFYSLFEYPSVFHISFMDSSFLYSFKPAVLTNMSVNYHGQGDAYYFDLNGTKVPSSIILNLEFVETEIVTRRDYQNENVATERGFVNRTKNINQTIAVNNPSSLPSDNAGRPR